MRELHDFPGGLLLEPHKEITDQKMSILHPLPERMFLAPAAAYWPTG